MDYLPHRTDDCRGCLKRGLVKPMCALCRMEYNLGEDHGGQWCSEECRWWSDILVRNMTDDLVIASEEKWLLFYRARFGHDIPLENIPNPRDFYPVLTDRKYVGKTAHRRVTSLPAHLYASKEKRTYQIQGETLGTVQANYPRSVPFRGRDMAVLYKRCGTGRSSKGSNRPLYPKLPLLNGVAV